MMSGIASGFIALWALHILSVIVFGIGIVFLLLWANKQLTVSQLKTWSMWFIIIGIVLCLFTIGVKGSTWGPGGMGRHGTFMMKVDREGGGIMMKGGMMGGGSMMSNMGMMLEGLEGDEFDEAFIELMIPHHEGAIDMAEEALENAKHAEIKNLANAIIKAQQTEIDQMKAWAEAWGYEE